MELTILKLKLMKQTLLLFGLLSTFSLNAQIPETYQTSKLIPGCPKEIEPIQNMIQLSDMSYALLKTGIDSLQVMFGEFTKSGNKDYWVSLFDNDKPPMWTIVQLSLDKETGITSNTLDIKYDNSTKMLSVKIQHDVSTGEIKYSWIGDNSMSKTAIIKNIYKPIQKGKIFPPLKVETRDGDSISIKDFIGKYVVINWWATSCGPCRLEIPGLNFLVDKYKNNQNVIFLAIAFDKKEVLEDYLRLKPFNYIQTIGAKEASKLLGESFPVHVILNKEGIISFYGEGGTENRHLDIDEELNKLIYE